MSMSRKELNELKARMAKQKEEAGDMQTLMAAIMALPYGQVKKVMTDEIMTIFAKYGYE